MQKQKCQKPLVIPPADALIQPNTVVVHFLHTEVTYFAVFGAGGLVKMAGWAGIPLLVHDAIILIQF